MKKVEESGSFVKFVKSPQNPFPQCISTKTPKIKLPQTQKIFHFLQPHKLSSPERANNVSLGF